MSKRTYDGGIRLAAVGTAGASIGENLNKADETGAVAADLLLVVVALARSGAGDEVGIGLGGGSQSGHGHGEDGDDDGGLHVDGVGGGSYWEASEESVCWRLLLLLLLVMILFFHKRGDSTGSLYLFHNLTTLFLYSNQI